ncbi:MAG: bifunctional serine/threonine-protein kinase/formylglycine-generating enzyme family protein [Gemmataceae bacterium]
MLRLLRCIGEAVAAQGMRALAGLVPLGQQMYDIAADAIERYRRAELEACLRQDADQVLQASSEEVRLEASRIAQEVLAGRPPEEIALLEQYLIQVPTVARQPLKRPSDPGGTTVPGDYNLLDPIQLGNLLPQRLPRFRRGENVPQAPQWQFVDLLGAGGFGEVWLARHAFLGHHRAIKFCLDPAARERLLRHEGEVVRQVMLASAGVHEHEHGIVPLLDAYLEGETPWLAYEYIQGGDLSTLVREQSMLSAEQRGRRALEVLMHLSGVVGRLHTLPQPVVHRDLKPANVLVKWAGPKWTLRVTDFGISHVRADQSLGQASRSTASLNLGETYRGAHTPIYASPQQKRGLAADVRDDVHALGIIGWQLLLGDLTAERPAGKWRKRVAECQLPEPLLDLLESCWDDDPAERPANGAILAQHLRQAGGPATSCIVLPPDSVIAPASPVQAVKAAPTLPARFTNTWKMEFVLVPRGSFWMGGGQGKCGSKQVTIDHDFYIGVYPVTQRDWISATGENPSKMQKGFWSWLGVDELSRYSDEDLLRLPVESVSWTMCQQYLRKLNEKLREPGWIYRLPLEAEWEYACRGAASSQADCAWSYYFQKPTNNLTPQVANYVEASLNRPTRVGGYGPNRLGIHDMHGNVGEWVEDAFTGWKHLVVNRPAYRVFRGGSFAHDAEKCQASSRSAQCDPLALFSNVGLRLVRVPE